MNNIYILSLDFVQETDYQLGAIFEGLMEIYPVIDKVVPMIADLIGPHPQPGKH